MVLCVLPLSEKLAGLEVNGEMDMVGLDRKELQCNILLSYYVICASIPYMEVCGNMPNMVICYMWKYAFCGNMVVMTTLYS